MMENNAQISKARRILTPTVMFAVLSTLEFLAYYLFCLFLSDYAYYYEIFCQRLLLFVLLVAASISAYISSRSIKDTLLISSLISLTRAIFFVPFFYLDFLGNPLYDSIDALALAIFASIIGVVVHTVLVAVLSIIIGTVCKKHCTQKNKICALLNFKHPLNSTVLVISLVIALINFAVEFVTVLVFLIQSSGILFINEAIYIVISLLFPILLMIGIYFLSLLITMLASYFLSKSKKTDKENQIAENQ